MAPVDKTTGQDGEQDLAILYPERTATIAGVQVTMREYSFAEGLRLHALVSPIVDAIKAVTLGGELADVDALRAVFGEHADAVMQLIATACNQPLDWVQSLNDESGHDLQLLWWAVNGPFFVRRVRESLLVHRLKASAGLTSTPRSSATATPPAPSATTPSVS